MLFTLHHRNPVRTAEQKSLRSVGDKAGFHFNRIVPKRIAFLCFLSTKVELMVSTQKKTLRYVTIRLKSGNRPIRNVIQYVPYRKKTSVNRESGTICVSICVFQKYYCIMIDFIMLYMSS